MKITDLELIPVQPRMMFLKMHTDEDLIGYGEPIVEGHAHVVEAAVEQYKEYLIGKDPRRIEHHWQVLYRGGFYRGGPVLVSALSGIEQAMWDILGKSLGVPVYQLLGGAVRDRIRMYSHVITGKMKDDTGYDAGALVTNAKEKVAQGFTCLKFNYEAPVQFVETKKYLDTCVDIFGRLREGVGDEVDIALDLHGRFSPAQAKRLIKAIEPFHPMFVEEPCLPENVDAMVDIAHSTTVPIATGERLYTKWGFREIIERRAAAIIQPDLCHAGGILEVRKIAAMAESHYIGVAPHNPLGPISLAAALQADACTPNFVVQEQVTLGEGYLKQPFELQDGHIVLPSGPGLGIELDDDALENLRYDGKWRVPLVWHADGAIADW